MKRLLPPAVLPPAGVSLLLVALLIPSARAAEPAPAPSPAQRLEALLGGDAPGSVEDLRVMQEHVQRLIERVTPCVVGVRVGGAQGSGVIISEDGFVLTAGHVVGTPDREVTFYFHDGTTAKGKTLGVDRGIDSGLMVITDEGKWPHIDMGDSTELKTGQWCLALGHPGGYERNRKPVVRFGRVLSNRRGVISTDCTLVGGDSGGPLFDMAGKVIGIHSRIGSSLAANMHVPVATYRDTWDRLAAGEAWGSMGETGPFIGVGADPDANEAKIGEVFPDTPAEKAGLLVGDVILRFADEEVKAFPDLARLVRTKEPGDEVTLVIRRGDTQMEVKLTIGRRGG